MVVIIPRLLRMWNRVYRINPWCLPICLSFCPSVCRQGFRNFLNKAITWFVSYLAFTIMGCASWPLFISVFILSILANWSPNFCRKMRFPDLKKKTTSSIHFIPGVYPKGWALDTYSFSILTFGFGPLMAKCLPEKGVSRIKNYQVPVTEPWRKWGNLSHGSIKNLSYNDNKTKRNTVVCIFHYSDVIMDMVASQITSLTIVYSTVYSKCLIKENITGLCVGNSTLTGEFLAQRAGNAEKVSI